MPAELSTAQCVSKVEINRSRSFVFVGHCDEQVRMYNALSWREMFCFDHSLEQLTEFNSSDVLNIYFESESPDGIYYEALNRPFKVPRGSLTGYLTSFASTKQQLETKTALATARGISLIAVSNDDRYCATKNEQTPCCVWVWDLQELTLNSLIVQQSPIADLAWCPRTNNLNISTKSSRLFLWSPKGASVCQVPVQTSDGPKGTQKISPSMTLSTARLSKGKPATAATNLTVSSVVWNPNGTSFAALDR